MPKPVFLTERDSAEIDQMMAAGTYRQEVQTLKMAVAQQLKKREKEEGQMGGGTGLANAFLSQQPQPPEQDWTQAIAKAERVLADRIAKDKSETPLSAIMKAQKIAEYLALKQAEEDIKKTKAEAQKNASIQEELRKGGITLDINPKKIEGDQIDRIEAAFKAIENDLNVAGTQAMQSGTKNAPPQSQTPPAFDRIKNPSGVQLEGIIPVRPGQTPNPLPNPLSPPPTNKTTPPGNKRMPKQGDLGFDRITKAPLEAEDMDLKGSFVKPTPVAFKNPNNKKDREV